MTKILGEANSPAPALLVNRQHLIDGLHMVARLRGLGSKAARFKFQADSDSASGQLLVEFGHYTFLADAEGTWPGFVSMKALVLRQVARSTVPGGESVFLTFQDGQLRLHRSPDHAPSRSYDAAWHEP